MFNTMTHATFKHNGCYVTARRMVDTATGKFYGWSGSINSREDFTVVAKSLKKFEETFIQLVDTKRKEIFMSADESI